MRVFVDLDSHNLVQGPGQATAVDSLRFKRAPAAPIEVVFTRNGEIVELDGDAVGIFGVKTTGKYDDDYVTSALPWTKVGTGIDTYYLFTLSLINPALDDQFEVDGDGDNDVARLTLMGELQWITLGQVSKTPTIVIVVDNDVVREYDFSPPDFIFDDTDPDSPTVMLGDDNQPLLN
jgi:hypothetical protein